jgi:hypothetical protein
MCVFCGIPACFSSMQPVVCISMLPRPCICSVSEGFWRPKQDNNCYWADQKSLKHDANVARIDMLFKAHGPFFIY